MTHTRKIDMAHSEGEDYVDVPLLPLPLLPAECHPLLHRLSIEQVLWELKICPRHTVIKGQVTLNRGDMQWEDKWNVRGRHRMEWKWKCG